MAAILDSDCILIDTQAACNAFSALLDPRLPLFSRAFRSTCALMRGQLEPPARKKNSAYAADASKTVQTMT